MLTSKVKPNSVAIMSERFITSVLTNAATTTAAVATVTATVPTAALILPAKVAFTALMVSEDDCDEDDFATALSLFSPREEFPAKLSFFADSFSLMREDSI